MGIASANYGIHSTYPSNLVSQAIPHFPLVHLPFRLHLFARKQAIEPDLPACEFVLQRRIAARAHDAFRIGAM